MEHKPPALDKLKRFSPLQNEVGTRDLIDESSQDSAAHYANSESLTQQRAALSEESYNLDAAGQLIGKSVGNKTVTFGYDQTGQLLEPAHSVKSTENEEYVYDSSGNRLSTGSQLNKNTIAPANRIASDATFTYSYDAEGNLDFKTEIATGRTWRYLYDHRNRMIEATQIAVSDPKRYYLYVRFIR